MKLKFSIIASIIALVAAVIVFQNNQQPHSSAVLQSIKAPAVSKTRQHVNIEIDYEKLPKRNEIRLIGKIDASDLNISSINYKWIIKDNLKVSRGNLAGTISSSTKEVTLDVLITDMNKKFDVRLEAFVNANNVKIGNIKFFQYDPTNEDIQEEEALEAQNKMKAQHLSKEQFLEQELRKTRKISIQQ